MQALTVASKLDWTGWLDGLIGAIVSGGSSAVTAAFSANMIDPKDWNLSASGAGASHMLKLIGLCFAVSGVISMFKYLQTRPTPTPPAAAQGATMKAVIVLMLLLGSALSLHAQTPSLGQYQLGMGYASVGGPTDNGTLLTFSKQFSPRVWGQAKGFLLANPSGVTIATVGPRYRPPLSAIWKASKYFDTTKFMPFVDLNLGTVKDATGAAKFAYGVGAGLDYVVAPNVTLLLIEADYDRSNFFPAGGILVTNVHTVTSGLKFTF